MHLVQYVPLYTNVLWVVQYENFETVLGVPSDFSG